MHTPLGYRPHIDGLRAIAVLGVVTFHFGLTAIPGGFLGVDVFFVISGFLIAKVLYRDIHAGDFSLIGFYERRAKRILPAFFVVSAVSAVAASVLLLPQSLVGFARSLLAASLFVSNIYFYETSDYFAPAANQIPLLHYWSLSVEEQFYFLFPLALLAIFRWAPRALSAAIVVGLLLSLAASEAMLRSSPSAAFYLLPFRAFELLIGCMVALPGVRFPQSMAVAETSTLAGALLIVAGMLGIDERFGVPGFTALIPCVGTALVIWGSEATQTRVGRALGAAPFAAIGRISYSLYLVHWPVAAFGHQLFPHVGKLTFFVAGTAAALALGWISYRFVELPVRERRPLSPRPVVFTASLAAIIACAFASAEVIRLQGFPERLNARVARTVSYLAYNITDMFRSGTCFLGPEQKPEDLKLDVCAPAAHPSVILWGDSNVAHYYWGLRDALQPHGVHLGQLTYSACAPVLGVANAARPHCQDFNDLAFAAILAAKPQLVVLGGGGMSLADLDRTLAKLKTANIAFVVMGPSPAFTRPVPLILAERMQRGDANVMSGPDADPGNFGRDDAMKRHFAVSRVRYISVLDVVCPRRQCPLAVDGIPLHFDTLHLTREGSRYYSARLVGRLLTTTSAF